MADYLSINSIHIGIETIGVKLDLPEETPIVCFNLTPFRLAQLVMIINYNDLGRVINISRFKGMLEKIFDMQVISR